MRDDEKEDIEEDVEEKKKDRSWWQKIPPLYLVLGGIVIFFALRSMMQLPEQRNQYLLMAAMAVVVLYILSQGTVKEEALVTPKEAELLVEREIQRKLAWGQFPLMTKYQVGPVSQIIHRDARGMYYPIAVKMTNPYDIPRNYIAQVMIKGPERGFVVMQETLTPFTGRERQQEKTIVPDWMKRTRQYPLLEKLFGRYGGF